MKYVPPSVHETAFNCPHCDTLTQQFWYSAHANELEHDKVPVMAHDLEDTIVALNSALATATDKAKRPIMPREKYPFLSNDECCYVNWIAEYIWFSSCFNCKRLTIWINDRMVYPARGKAPPANPDLPDDIRLDYDEASSILDRSPRGAAALIRLAIQKLCRHLGQPGRNLNSDIGALVANGLDSSLQKALDSVRVIGNNAVHPGTIDLRDDRATAETLLMLLNLIGEKLISQPRRIDEIYNRLPTESRQQIDQRDA